MARRTFADFDAQLLLRMGNRTDVDATMRGHLLNDAYRWVCNVWDHPELQGTSVEVFTLGSDIMPVTATDIWHPTFLRNITDGYPLEPRGIRELEKLNKPTTRTPKLYAWYDGKFEFDVVSGAAVSIRIKYKRRPAEFSAAAPVIDQLFDLAILTAAAIFGFESVRDFEEANMQRTMLDRWVKDVNFPVDEETKTHEGAGIKVRYIR
jgi:hypothetical protein